MALGNNYDSNKKENNTKDYNFSMDSGYRFYNGESQVDATGIKFGYWNNMLKITIAPKSSTVGANNSGEFDTYDWDKGASAFISPIKAYMLYKEIEGFLQNPDAYINRGIPIGSRGDKIIYICNGKEFGGQQPCLVLLGVDEKGTVQSTSVYEFKNSFNFAIHNFDAENKSFDKYFYPDAEIDSIVTILKEYCKAMAGAHAYSTISNNQKNSVRVKYSLEAIAAGIGVELYGGKSSNRKPSGPSFFSGNGNSSNKPEPTFENANIDDLI